MLHVPGKIMLVNLEEPKRYDFPDKWPECLEPSVHRQMTLSRFGFMPKN